MALHLKRHGVEVGRRPLYHHALPIVENAGRIVIGDDFRVSALQTRPELGTGPQGLIEIGDTVFINKGVTIHARQHVAIGDHCLIGDYACLWDTSFHEVSPEATVQAAPVRLGKNVWVGRSAIVMPGITIGDHAVVAAGSVVTHDVSPKTVVAGVPARQIKAFDCSDDYIRQ